MKTVISRPKSFHNQRFNHNNLDMFHLSNNLDVLLTLQEMNASAPKPQWDMKLH